MVIRNVSLKSDGLHSHLHGYADVQAVARALQKPPTVIHQILDEIV